MHLPAAFRILYLPTELKRKLRKRFASYLHFEHGINQPATHDTYESFFLEEFFSETRLTLRAQKVVWQLQEPAESREALPTL